MPAGGEELARRFYTGVLGIPEVPKPFPQNTRGGAWFETDEIRIHLGIEQDFRPARKAHPAILVSDLKTLTQRLDAAEIAVIEGEPLEGYEHIYVSDPFDNRIEFIEAKRK
jgi:catechol 2,3-dioxygenase-like lactoylglutathione lyase family enzyme